MVSELPINKTTGEIISSCYTWTKEENIDYVPNIEFYDELQLSDYYKGRSAINFRFTSKTDKRTHNMLLTDFFDMMKRITMVNGLVSGRWIYCKRGTSYGVQYVGP